MPDVPFSAVVGIHSHDVGAWEDRPIPSSDRADGADGWPSRRATKTEPFLPKTTTVLARRLRRRRSVAGPGQDRLSKLARAVPRCPSPRRWATPSATWWATSGRRRPLALRPRALLSTYACPSSTASRSVAVGGRAEKKALANVHSTEGRGRAGKRLVPCTFIMLVARM